MGTVPVTLARRLKRRLALRRAVETGTWAGGGALLLSDVFRDVTTIEVSEDVAQRAAVALSAESIRVVNADSRSVLHPSKVPSFYFLDGHWCGGSSGGEIDECPLLEELELIGGGHEDDCIVIDDARLFVDPPPPPHRPEQWPSLAEIEERLRKHWPHHAVVVAHDQIVAVPSRAADIAERFAASPFEPPRRERNLVRRALRKARRLVREARAA